MYTEKNRTAVLFVSTSCPMLVICPLLNRDGLAKLFAVLRRLFVIARLFFRFLREHSGYQISSATERHAYHSIEDLGVHLSTNVLDIQIMMDDSHKNNTKCYNSR